MFNDVTLYPGGAFMLCESIGEFDDNMPAPAPAAVPSDWNAEDPVIKLISKMKPIYDQRIAPLLNMNYSYETSEDERSVSDLCGPIAVFQYRLLFAYGFVYEERSQDSTEWLHSI